jgi:hypothetical protein
MSEQTEKQMLDTLQTIAQELHEMRDELHSLTAHVAAMSEVAQLLKPQTPAPPPQHPLKKLWE